jgi:hypothetical protein
MLSLAPTIRATLHCIVTSKKGVIGLGIPLNPLRRKPQSPHMVCGFFVRAPFMAARRAGASLAGSRKRVPGIPTRRAAAPFGIGAAVFANRTCLEAFMADRFPVRALAPAVPAPVSGNSDPIRLHAAAHNALSTAMHYLHQPQADLTGARRKVARAMTALRRLHLVTARKG